MFDNLQQQLQSDSPEIRIDALLDAFKYGIEGLKLIAAALEDRDREVRQSALLLLSESETGFAKQALYNYLPFSNMDCLHTITEFQTDTSYNIDFFLIANHNNTLIAYWLLDYFPVVQTWDLATGSIKNYAEVGGADSSIFGLGKEGKSILVNFQNHIWEVNTNTLEDIDKFHSCDIRQFQYIDPYNNSFAVCPTDNSLIAIGSIYSQNNIIEIKNYQTYESYIKYKIENLFLCTRYNRGINPSPSDEWLEQFSTMIFSPDGKFLVINLYHKNKNSNLLHIWDIENKKLIKTIDNLPKLAIISLATNPKGNMIACGVREDKICVWQLQSDSIIHTVNEFAPCTISSDGRVLIYATANYDLIIWDLVNSKQLNILQGHTAPIIYIAISKDREFIASYSCDKQIKIWGI